MEKVNNVFAVGGTHGNELHGIYLVNEITTALKSEELACKFPSLSISGVIANNDAMKSVGAYSSVEIEIVFIESTGAGRRYCDTDLNRCFLTKDLNDSSINTIEGLRAKELNKQLGPKLSKAPKADLILDFHSTTSNTGILLLCHPQDKFSHQIIAYLQSLHSNISGCLWADSESPLLPSIGRSGITVEVGPIAHSTSNSLLYQFTKKILNDILVYTEKHNTYIRTNDSMMEILDPRVVPTHILKATTVTLYRVFATVGFPRNSLGAISALIHPNLQGAPELGGGTTVQIGDPIFQVMSDGSDINYAGSGNVEGNSNDSNRYRIVYSSIESTDEILYPMFINEAAYNEKDIAFNLMIKYETTVNIISS